MTRLTFAAVALSFLAVGACSQHETLPGVATASLGTVPTGVYCVEITVADSAHAISQRFDVMPGTPALLEITGIPIGVETFSGAAFPASCVATGVQPTWLADPVTVFVPSGYPAQVNLRMRKVGSAEVGIDWGDDGGVDGGPVDLSGPTDGGVVDLAYPQDYGIDLSQPPDLTTLPQG
jgi:hypothetical protein